MTGRFYIDGMDAHELFGVSLAKGAYEAIVAYPPLKPVDTNDWHEYDGIEADLSDPKLDTRTISIPFTCLDWYNTGTLFDLLTDGSYHTFLFSDLSLTLRLRLVSQSSVKTLKLLQLFTLDFADDFPLDGFVYQEASEGDFTDSYELDEKNFGSYGIMAQNGTLEEVYKLPEVKENRLVNISNKSGAIYQGNGLAKFKEKEVSLKLLMRSADITTFWKNYYAFLYKLVQPNERYLVCFDTEDYFTFYYKNAAVSEFHIFDNGRVWCKFQLNVVFTSFRMKTFDTLLAEQKGGLITEQTGENYINLA